MSYLAEGLPLMISVDLREPFFVDDANGSTGSLNLKRQKFRFQDEEEFKSYFERDICRVYPHNYDFPLYSCKSVLEKGKRTIYEDYKGQFKIAGEYLSNKNNYFKILYEKLLKKRKEYILFNDNIKDDADYYIKRLLKKNVDNQSKGIIYERFRKFRQRFVLLEADEKRQTCMILEFPEYRDTQGKN